MNELKQNGGVAVGHAFRHDSPGLAADTGAQKADDMWAMPRWCCAKLGSRYRGSVSHHRLEQCGEQLRLPRDEIEPGSLLVH